MWKAMPWFAAFVLLAVGGCAQDSARQTEQRAASPDDTLAETRSLFVIERSKNANTVHYDAQLTPDGRLNPEEPVIAYYVMLAEDGRRKELNWVEKKMAYGFDIRPDASVDGYSMAMVAAPGRVITVREDRGAVRAELVIDGRPAVLEKMYIEASDGFPWPTVHYVELHGRDIQTGEMRFEKVVPK